MNGARRVPKFLTDDRVVATTCNMAHHQRHKGQDAGPAPKIGPQEVPMSEYEIEMQHGYEEMHGQRMQGGQAHWRCDFGPQASF